MVWAAVPVARSAVVAREVVVLSRRYGSEVGGKGGGKNCGKGGGEVTATAAVRAAARAAAPSLGRGEGSSRHVGAGQMFFGVGDLHF